MNGYKFGVIYAKEGQFTDDDMFQNGKFDCANTRGCALTTSV